MRFTAADSHDATTTSPPWSNDMAGAAAALICAVVIWGAARIADVDLAVERGDDVQHVTGWAVAVTAAVTGLLGLTLLRLLERRTTRALKVWTIVVVIVTLVTFMGPLLATSSAATGTLLSLHAVVAAVVIASAWATRRVRRPAS